MKVRRFVILMLCFLIGCTQTPSISIPHRESLIPDGAEKMTPADDPHPPIAHSDEFEAPIPLPYPVNTRGFEDSAFILPDGKTLYFFYTPDANVEIALQAQDLVTGIYVTNHTENGWTEPERVWLTEPGFPVLDGCPFVTADTLWFCTVREGLTGIHWFAAQF
ncbi:MAG: hypothetical protein V2J07_02660, partial [Anaerolineae bacterium]|nr:hypothetical protein [Anaerolineae bacterium]